MKNNIYLLSILLAEYLPKIFKKVMCYIGKNSMGILVFHFLMFGIVKLIYVLFRGINGGLFYENQHILWRQKINW